MPDIGGGASAGAPYPWLQAAWGRVTTNIARIPHALLLTGAPGIGKNELAAKLAALLLCLAPEDDQPCGTCRSCRLRASGAHPDLEWITPQEERKSISIDQIRALQEFLVLTPHTATRKLVVLSPAEAMTLQAANALLKLLEEPPAGSVLILVSHQPQRLPVTIRSRCSRIELRPPDRTTGLRWLHTRGVADDVAGALLGAASDAPLLALALAGDGFAELRQGLLADLIALTTTQGNPLAVAERWQKKGTELCLLWLQGCLLDLLKLGQGAGSPDTLANPDAAERLSGIAQRVPGAAIAELQGIVIEARRLLGTGIDERLLLEDILIRWMKLKN
jgi:DNA polymerase-3 subunit delta'